MPFEDEVAIICNEEGKVNGLTPNRAVYKENSREIQDIICGKFFVAYAPFEAEKFQSLPPDLAEQYREKFKYPERFMRVNNEIVRKNPLLIRYAAILWVYSTGTGFVLK